MSEITTEYSESIRALFNHALEDAGLVVDAYDDPRATTAWGLLEIRLQRRGINLNNPNTIPVYNI